MGTSDFRSVPRLLALVAPTTVIGTVRPRARRKCNYVLNRTIGLAQDQSNKSIAVSYITEISNSFG
jgi:hypothetical protein